MITTLMLASAYLSAPTILESVNFVHSYKKDEKTTYELTISSEAEGFEAMGEFELSIKSSLKDGKMKVTFAYLKLDMDGEDMTEAMQPVDFDINKHGVPLSAMDDDASIIAFVSLLMTYLPGESLDEGASFKAKLPEDAFSYEGTGKFDGMKKKDGKDYAVLKTKGSLVIQDEATDSEITTYYDPKTKRVVFAEATFETPDDLYSLNIKFKK